MAKEKQTLLPCPGTLEWEGRKLRIERLVSAAGYTSVVYEGWLAAEQPGEEDIHVAVKAMKPLDLAHARRFFQEEAVALFRLNQYFGDTQEKEDLPQIPPRYYGKGEHDNTPFLMMEFVEGREVADILQKSSGRLPEAQALTIGWQLFSLLDVLHTQLKKTFVDLKFENLWWVDGNEETPGYLKVLDLGTLEDIKPTEDVPEGVRRDLLLGGVYLCYLITGQQPAYSMMGYLRKYREADEIIRKGEMSWGLREWLFKLLHRNPQMRPTSAGEVAKALRELAEYWILPLDRVLKYARTSLAHLEQNSESEEVLSADDREKARRVRSMLSIAVLRDKGDDSIQEDIKRAEDILHLTEPAQLGKRALRARAYELARERFEEGMQWSIDPAPLRRWAYLARVGDEIGPSVFEQYQEQAFQMVDWFNQGDWMHGLERLEKLRPYLLAQGLEMLYVDARLFMALEESEAERGQGHFSQAAQALRNAQEWLQKLGNDAEFITREEIGDLEIQVRELENRAESEERAEIEMKNALHLLSRPEPAWGEVVTKARDAFSLAPPNPARLKNLRDLVEKAIEKTAYEPAQQLAEIALRYAPLPNEFLEILYLSRDLSRAQKSLIASDWDGLLFLLRRVQGKYNTLSTTRRALQHLRTQAAVEFEHLQDLTKLDTLVTLAKQQNETTWVSEWEPKARKIEEQRKKALQEQVDRIISDVEILLQPDDLRFEQRDDLFKRFGLDKAFSYYEQEEHRLDKALQMILDAKRVALESNYRQDELNTLEHRVTARLEVAQKEKEQWKTQSEEKRQSQLEHLKHMWDALQRFADWGKKASQAGARIPIQREIARQIETETVELIRLGQVFLSKVDSENREVRDMLDEAYILLDRIGTRGWKVLLTQAEEHIHQIQKQFKPAYQFFKSGKLHEAVAELERLEPDYGLSLEWTDLKERVIQAERLKKLCKRLEGAEGSDVDEKSLRQIREYLQAGLPAVYYSALRKVLEMWRQKVKQEILSRREQFAQPEFAVLLRRWVSVELTRQMLEHATTKEG